MIILLSHLIHITCKYSSSSGNFKPGPEFVIGAGGIKKNRSQDATPITSEAPIYPLGSYTLEYKDLIFGVWFF